MSSSRVPGGLFDTSVGTVADCFDRPGMCSIVLRALKPPFFAIRADCAVRATAAGAAASRADAERSASIAVVKSM